MQEPFKLPSKELGEVYFYFYLDFWNIPLSIYGTERQNKNNKMSSYLGKK